VIPNPRKIRRTKAALAQDLRDYSLQWLYWKEQQLPVGYSTERRITAVLEYQHGLRLFGEQFRVSPPYRWRAPVAITGRFQGHGSWVAPSSERNALRQ